MAELRILGGNTSDDKVREPAAGDTYGGTVTLQAATGNEVAFNLQYTTNKATSGNDTGLVINQTDTLSPGTSLLADFQAGGVTQAKITNAGYVQAKRLYIDDTAGDNGTYITDGYIGLKSGGILAWTSNATGGAATNDLTLYRDAAYTLAQRHGTNAQTFRCYGSYTDGSNYERLSISHNGAGDGIINVNSAGTGSTANLEFQLDGTTLLRLYSSTYVGFNNSAGPVIKAEGGLSSTVPVIIANNFDLDTGLGSPLADQISMIAGGVEVLRCIEDTGNAIMLPTGQTVSGLPTTPAVGMIARVTDANAPAVGSTVAGSGAAAALVWYNGSNWTVIGV